MISNSKRRRIRRQCLAARFKGKEAAILGKPVSDNPYNSRPIVLQLAWLEGWNLGTTQIEEPPRLGL